MDEMAITIKNLSKKYKIYKQPYYRLLEWASFGNIKLHQEYWALKDISISLRKGECIGIIGANGAGKSTLLKILSKALWPTEGDVKINGNMVSLLELGTGFHPELTGKENLYNSSRLLGFSRDYVDGKFEGIVEFSGLQDAIYQPVKNYSSGMYVRLAFSLYANLEPDIYVVDEALSVGDIFFQQKCFSFLQKLKNNGTAIILVTHDMQTVLKYCDKVYILERGKITQEGSAIDMVNLFYSIGDQSAEAAIAPLLEDKEHAKFEVPTSARIKIKTFQGLRRGNQKIEFVGAELTDLDGKEMSTATTGEKIKLVLYVRANENIDNVTFGFQITDRLNTVVFGQNAYMITRTNIRLDKSELVKATFDIDLKLFQGLYTFALAITDCQVEATNVIYDWLEGCLLLEVVRPDWRTFHGVAELETSFNIMYHAEVKLEQN